MKFKNKFPCLFIIIIMVTLAFNCDNKENITAPYESKFEVSVAKWYENHTAAITLNYDTGSPYIDREKKVTDKVVEYGLRMDFEIVAKNYEDRPYMRDYFEDYLIPLGFGYFGHGYEHVNHDELTYDSAYTSIKLTWDIMMKYGLKPVSFAYPGGFGFEEETHRALKNVGFLNGRFHSRFDTVNPYILPDGEEDAMNWYELPSLVMEAYDFRDCAECVNDNTDLVPILDGAIEKHAWIILTYHNIGYPDGWGYYDWDEFVADLEAITQRDFWNATMDNITLYIKERQQVAPIARAKFNCENEIEEIQITLSDGLDNSYYDQELTVLFDVPKNWINKNIELSQGYSNPKTLKFDNQNGMISLKPNEKTYFLRKSN